MIDRVFQVVGERVVTPAGRVQLPVMDQMTGEVSTFDLGPIENTDAIVPGFFLCVDTASTHIIARPADTFVESANTLGYKDVALRFGKVLEVFPREDPDSLRFTVSYIGKNDESSVASVTIESPSANTDEPSDTEHQDIVAGSIMVLALSVSDLSAIVGGWCLDDET
ncbi:MAG: hypothetical protein LBK61_01895 [Spirochaetaceae bacterium]|jgi:hypothetical protein|nr:hypothetical protein [Spirochaetaceae bacterium]